MAAASTTAVGAAFIVVHGTVQRASDGYSRKYGDSGVVDSMMIDEVLPTTLRLEPR